MNEDPAGRPAEPGRVGDLIATALNGLASRIDEIANEADRQRERLLALEDRLGRLEDGHRDHEAWLRNLSHHRTAERLTPGDFAVHQEISTRYRDLIGQRLLDTAVMAGADSPHAEATIRADLARVLFEPAAVQRGPDQGLAELGDHGVTVTAELFRELWEAAEEIRSGAAASGHPHRWVLAASPGVALDPSWQEPCDGCRATDPILLVVAPAYQVEDRFYVKQLVFTQSPSATDNRSPGPAGDPSEGIPSEPAPPSDKSSAGAAQPDTAGKPWWRRLFRRPSAAAQH